jgi:hypothetical protein
MVVLAGAAVMAVGMLAYHFYMKRRLRREMSGQVNTIVSQYMQYYDKE